jgi:hypothetical protein
MERAILETVLSEFGKPLNEYLWQISLNITDVVWKMCERDSEAARDKNEAGGGGDWKSTTFELASVAKTNLDSKLTFESRANGANAASKPQALLSQRVQSGRSEAQNRFEKRMSEAMEIAAILAVEELFSRPGKYRCCCVLSGSALRCSSPKTGYHPKEEEGRRQHLEQGKELVFCRLSLSPSAASSAEGDRTTRVVGRTLVEIGLSPAVSEIYDRESRCSLQLVLDKSTDDSEWEI